MKISSIGITKRTKYRLKSITEENETYEDVILRLIEVIKNR